MDTFNRGLIHRLYTLDHKNVNSIYYFASMDTFKSWGYASLYSRSQECKWWCIRVGSLGGISSDLRTGDCAISFCYAQQCPGLLKCAFPKLKPIPSAIPSIRFLSPSCFIFVHPPLELLDFAIELSRFRSSQTFLGSGFLDFAVELLDRPTHVHLDREDFHHLLKQRLL